ncbi:hypothetical protein EYF80_063818 [Liparis tanakae]|uniref:Uncharacterized protein n=1 Tax=Liparis tanakae TaxID=230148 RepID=A0A4Z2EB27_9TELE|nr:hypothetical protein EYF80_063818 [Liparis tanakae]
MRRASGCRAEWWNRPQAAEQGGGTGLRLQSRVVQQASGCRAGWCNRPQAAEQGGGTGLRLQSRVVEQASGCRAGWWNRPQAAEQGDATGLRLQSRVSGTGLKGNAQSMKRIPRQCTINCCMLLLALISSPTTAAPDRKSITPGADWP